MDEWLCRVYGVKCVSELHTRLWPASASKDAWSMGRMCTVNVTLTPHCQTLGASGVELCPSIADHDIEHATFCHIVARHGTNLHERATVDVRSIQRDNWEPDLDGIIDHLTGLGGVFTSIPPSSRGVILGDTYINQAAGGVSNPEWIRTFVPLMRNPALYGIGLKRVPRGLTQKLELPMGRTVRIYPQVFIDIDHYILVPATHVFGLLLEYPSEELLRRGILRVIGRVQRDGDIHIDYYLVANTSITRIHDIFTRTFTLNKTYTHDARHFGVEFISPEPLHASVEVTLSATYIVFPRSMDGVRPTRHPSLVRIGDYMAPNSYERRVQHHSKVIP